MVKAAVSGADWAAAGEVTAETNAKKAIKNNNADLCKRLCGTTEWLDEIWARKLWKTGIRD